MSRPCRRVLERPEAQQMATDLGTAIENIISLGAEGSENDKVLAFETLVLLNTKRNILIGELAYRDGEAAQ